MTRLDKRAATAKPENPNLDVGAEVRVARLNSLVAVRGELGRLYREARRREGRFPDAQVALRLAGVLGNVRTIIEVVELEQRMNERLAALEERITGRTPSPENYSADLNERLSQALSSRGH